MSDVLTFPRPNTCPVRAWAVDPSQPPDIQRTQGTLDGALAMAESALRQSGHDLEEAQRIARMVAIALYGAFADETTPTCRVYYALEDRIEREGWLR
jgi:hypothetical protein